MRYSSYLIVVFNSANYLCVFIGPVFLKNRVVEHNFLSSLKLLNSTTKLVINFFLHAGAHCVMPLDF